MRDDKREHFNRNLGLGFVGTGLALLTVFGTYILMGRDDMPVDNSSSIPVPVAPVTSEKTSLEWTARTESKTLPAAKTPRVIPKDLSSKTQAPPGVAKTPAAGQPKPLAPKESGDLVISATRRSYRVKGVDYHLNIVLDRGHVSDLLGIQLDAPENFTLLGGKYVKKADLGEEGKNNAQALAYKHDSEDVGGIMMVDDAGRNLGRLWFRGDLQDYTVDEEGVLYCVTVQTLSPGNIKYVAFAFDVKKYFSNSTKPGEGERYENPSNNKVPFNIDGEVEQGKWRTVLRDHSIGVEAKLTLNGDEVVIKYHSGPKDTRQRDWLRKLNGKPIKTY